MTDLRYAYYPGCAVGLNADAYGRSMRAIAKTLGMELVDIDDWNCCGATEYFSQENLTAFAVVARNLALVDKSCTQLTAPCSACYLNLREADEVEERSPAMAKSINEALAAGGLHYEFGSVKVRHLLDVLYTDIGEEKMRAAVTKPLEGLRLAAYYGCQVVRPYNSFDDYEHPTKMDELMGWLGADVVDYPAKTHCCGGHMTQISEPEAFELIRRLLQVAQDRKTDLIVCMCPMCQVNLDLYQQRVNQHFHTEFRIPVLFLTQLIGLAFGMNAGELGIGGEIVPSEPALRELLAVAR